MGNPQSETKATMFRLSLIAACMAASADAFAPASLPLSAGRRVAATNAASSLSMQRLGSAKSASNADSTAAQMLLTPELFSKLDADRSGSIDMGELKEALGNNAEVEALMKRADLNGDGVMDYAEYERLMNMNRFSDEQGGNLYVRNAIRLGFLKEGSVLEDCVMVGNKGFDPLNCATSMPALKNYREAELKHGRLARINPLFFMGIIVFTGTVESLAFGAASIENGRQPGDLGFDPLSLYRGKTEDVKRDLELKELNNGRLAMLAITTFAISEFVTKAPIA